MRTVQRSLKSGGWGRLTFAFGALSLATLAAVTSGCKSGKDDSGSGSGKSLYERLGGEPAITAVVNDFVAYAAPDPAVNFTRVGTPHEWQATPDNVAKLKKHLVQFVSKATGGPSTYEGKDMLTAHTGMQITEAQWGAIVADLKKALEKNGVNDSREDELIAIVATTHDQIVGK